MGCDDLVLRRLFFFFLKTNQHGMPKNVRADSLFKNECARWLVPDGFLYLYRRTTDCGFTWLMENAEGEHSPAGPVGSHVDML